MARIPLSVVPDTQVISTPPDDYQHIQSSPADFGGLIGQAEQKLGAEGEQAANNVTQIGLAQQQRFNQISGDDAMNQFMDAGDKLTFGVPGDPNSPGLFNLKGSKALEVGPQVVTSLGKLRDQIKNGLQNDAQKLQFDEQSRRYFQYKQGDISRHLSSQADVYGRMVNDSAIQTSAVEAAHNYTSDDAIAHSLANAGSFADKNSGLAALGPAGTPGTVDPNVLEVGRLKARGHVLQETVMNALAVDPNGGGAIRAQQILNTFGSTIDPDLRASLTAHVKGAGEQAGVAGAIDNIWATPPGTAVPSGRPAAPAGPIEPDAKVRADAVRDGLIKRGMDPDTATAFAANSLHESAANPNTGPGDGGASHGLFMWRGDRSTRFQNINGRPVDNAPLDQQLDYVMYELQGPESDAAQKVAQAQGPAAKAAAVSQSYLRPKDVVPEMQRRAATAVQLAGGSDVQGAGGVQGAPAGQAAAGSTHHIPEVFGFEEQKLAQAEQEAARLYPNNPHLQREIVSGVYEKIQRRNLFQQKYEHEVSEARREAGEQIQSNAIKAIHSDPTKFDESTIWQKDQAGNYILKPHEQSGLIAYAEQQLKAHGIEDITEYGPAFTRASNGIFAPEGAPNKINDLSDIIKMGVPGGGLSKRGVDYLTEMWVRSRKNPDVADMERASAHLMANAKTTILFPGAVDSSIALPFALRDPKGEALFNGQFATKWLQGFSEVKKTGDPKKIWDYLSQENLDKMVQGVRSEADKRKARMDASGQLTPADVEKPGTPLPPPPTLRTPDGKPMTRIDPLGWRDALANVPVRGDADRTPWTHAAWAKALTMLAEDPTKENMEEFDARFGIQGFKAEDLLRTMTAPRSVAAPAKGGEADVYDPTSGAMIPAATPVTPAAPAATPLAHAPMATESSNDPTGRTAPRMFRNILPHFGLPP